MLLYIKYIRFLTEALFTDKKYYSAVKLPHSLATTCCYGNSWYSYWCYNRTLFITLCYSKWVIFHFLLLFSTAINPLHPINTYLERITMLAIGPSCHLDFTSSLSKSALLHALLVILASACGWDCLMLDIIISHLNSPDVVSLLRAETEPKSTILLQQVAPFTTTKI